MSEPVTPLQAAIIALVVSAAGIAVGFGLFSSEVEQIVVSAVPVIVGSLFVIINEARHKTIISALVAKEDRAAYKPKAK